MSIKKRAQAAQTGFAGVTGLQVDYENAVFTRLAAARGRSGGADFDCFAPFGGRRRCCVSDTGAVNAFYGETGYTEDGSNGQVMVYQPKFYYRVEPLLLTPAATGTGHVIRKANYFVSPVPLPGFRLHPAFYGQNGTAVDHILLSAYEASYYDASLGRFFADGVDTDPAIDAAADRLCSLPGKKPISGAVKHLTAGAAESLAAARGPGWHLDTVKAFAANQLLMSVEYGTLCTQTPVGLGISTIPDTSGVNCASLTGSTASLGNGSGRAAATVNDKNGVQTTYTENGKTAVSYRGMENPWGNIWKPIVGMTAYGSGSSAGGEIFIADDLSFTSCRYEGNYKSAGLTLAGTSGFIAAMAYGGSGYDWLFIPGTTVNLASSTVPDHATVVANLSGSRQALACGRWSYSDYVGAFNYGFTTKADYYGNGMGCRLVWFPA